MANAIFKDPRHYQIATLFALLCFGWSANIFELTFIQFTAIVLTAVSAQFVGSVMIATKLDIRSALITALSLSLLLRSDAIAPLAVASGLAIGSKFALRLNDKHIFNPANFAIVAGTVFSTSLWTTPGQWGTAVFLAAFLAGIGMFITYRAARFDVPILFLSCFFALLIGRALWLGDPLSIPFHRMQNGALILFAFFMISDPKTTPDGLSARAIFAASAAALSYIFIFHLHMPDGMFYALACICVIRPALEIIDPAKSYSWNDNPPALGLSNWIAGRRNIKNSKFQNYNSIISLKESK